MSRLLNVSRSLILAMVYRMLDYVYIRLDREHLRRTKNIRLIPSELYREGGKKSYAEWAYVIGVMETLLFLHLDEIEENAVLDFGCGSGLMAIATEPYVSGGGRFIGLDVREGVIQFCRRQYPYLNFDFQCIDAYNPFYAASSVGNKSKWPVENESIDLVTALSVFTHLKEEDALFYFSEIGRVLRPGGKAILTFFLLDELYSDGVQDRERSGEFGKYHTRLKKEWVFDESAYGSDAWFSRSKSKVPESGIGVTRPGVQRAVARGGLEEVTHYVGSWKEVPGVFFQDILVFEK